LLPDAPNTRTREVTAIQTRNGYWHDRTFCRDTLTGLGFVDVQVELLDNRIDFQSPEDVAKGVWPVMPIFTMPWGEKKKTAGWKMFDAVEQVAAGDPEDGKGPYSIRFVSLVVTAKKPE